MNPSFAKEITTALSGLDVSSCGEEDVKLIGRLCTIDMWCKMVKRRPVYDQHLVAYYHYINKGE